MTESKKCRVVFAGTPEFAAVALQALFDSVHDVVGVLTQPDRPAGRGRSLTASPVKVLADEHAVPVLQPVTLKDEAAVTAIQELNCDVMVVAAYGLILPESVLAIPSLGCLNIHASLLPRWRGAAPIQRAILAGDAQTGVCIMKMDAGLDTGDVLVRATTPITPETTGGELHDTLARLGAGTLIDTLPDYCAGMLTAVPQPEQGVTYAEKLNKAEALLNFNDTAIFCHRKIQAFNPWPVAEAELGGTRYRIRRSRVTKSLQVLNNADVVAGRIISTEHDCIRVETGEDWLDILEIQKSGKKSILASDFSRGTDLTGQVFG